MGGSAVGGNGEAGAVGGVGGASTAGEGGASSAGDGGSAGMLDTAAGEGGAPSQSFSPDQLPGLALWLDAGVGVTASAAHRVSAWTDRTAHHNDASQTVAANQPLLVNEVINGHPVIHFDGLTSEARLDILDSGSLRWGTGDFSLEIVAAYANTVDATPRYGMMYGKFAEAAPYTGVILFGNYPSGATIFTGSFTQLDSVTEGIVSDTEDLNDGMPRLYAVRREAGTVTMQVNDADGAVIHWGTPDDVSAPGRSAYIGSQPSTQFLIGDIAEIVATAGTVSPADHAALTAYLMQKYGL
jgi:hypothetical protein